MTKYIVTDAQGNPLTFVYQNHQTKALIVHEDCAQRFDSATEAMLELLDAGISI